MVKLRLARQGRKKVPIYKIVAADSRARRDGRFIESLGQYRPSNEPGQKLVDLKETRVMHWLKVGAQPTDTVRSLLSGEGILLKWHLEKKNIEPARASEIFNTWKGKRDEKLAGQADAKLRAKEEAKKKAAKKKAEEEAAAIAAAAPAEAETPVAEEPKAEQTLEEPGAGNAAEPERPAESVEG
jgi:small subunit ribosomal protein S16